MSAAIRLAAHFRPKAEAHLLSAALQEAWAAKNAELLSQSNALGVPEVIAQHLEARFPRVDMDVCARYGLAKEIERINVRMYSLETELWDESVGIELPRPVLTPGNGGIASVYVCGPRFSRDPYRGCKPDYWAKMSDCEKAELVAFQDGQERNRLPEEVEPFFATIAATRKLFKAEYRVAVAWPAKHKQETGAYPTWQAIAERFPVLGAWLCRSIEPVAS